MAKKQLKKINQPKKYLQGGYNMGSVSMMRQTPYYLGQVEQNAAEAKLEETHQQAVNLRQTAVQAKRDAKAQQEAEIDQAVQQGVGTLGQAAVADKKAGNLGKFFVKNPLSGQAALNLSAGTQIAPAYVAPATTTISSNVGSLAPGATEVGANLASGTSTAWAPTVAAPTGEAITQGVATGAGEAGAGLSGVASAGIGIAANIGGTIIRNRTNDDSAYTFTDKERRGNTAGRMLSSAGTGFSIGNAIVPGIGGVIGGFTGATVGAIKARKENKAAEEEAKRLQREQNNIAAAYQSASINSSLTGIDTGFGLNSSFNPNTKATNYYQVARTGGVKKVKGGSIVPIKGTNAVEIKGETHEGPNGGVHLDKYAIAENKETMQPLVMNNGKKQDYIFSEYLKLGGKSFAQRHKELLANKAPQSQIQQLAAAQEKIAGRNPQQIAQYGGAMRYDKGGPVASKDCPPGTIYNAFTGNCDPFSFSSVSNMVSGKTATPVNVASNSTPTNNTPTNTGASVIPLVISKPGKKYSQAEKDAGWKYVYDVAKSLGDPFPEVTASQWALESGWGSSNTGTFNPFGQTASKGESGTRLNTPKDPGGGSKKFKNYSSYEEAIQDHINRWAPKYKGAKDPLEAVYMLQNHGGAPRYAEGHNNDWEGYVKKIIKLSDSRSKTFGVHRESTYVPDKTKYPKAKGVNVSTADTTPKLLPPPPVSGDVVPPTLAQRNSLPGVASMQMNEEIQMPEYPKSNITSDPTGPDYVNEQRPMKYITTETSEVNDRNFKRRRKVKPTLDVTNASAVAAAYDAGEITGEEYVAALQKGNALLKEENDKKRKELGIAQQNGTANAPAVAAYNAPVGVQPAGSPPPPVASATNGGPGGTAPTINNQNSTFQYTAKTPGYLDYSDPNTAGGIWSGDRYDKEWKPLVTSTMADPTKADQVLDYLLNYTGTDAADVKAMLEGKSKAEQLSLITAQATNKKVGPIHNAVYGAVNATNNSGGNVATNNPPANTGTGSGTTTNTGTTTGTGTTTRRYTPCPPGTYLSTDGTCKQTPEYSKPYDGNIAAGIGAVAQLAPPIYAALKPYQKVGPIAGAPSVRGAILGRENMNQERTTSREMNTAINQEVTNNNTGAAGFAIRQAAMAAANKQMLEIANAESKANIDLRGKEAVLGQDASKFNADNSMKGQMFNADLEQKQNQYVDERNIGVVDAAAERLAGMANTYNQYKATDHLARVTNANTHSLERDKMYESLLKDSQNKNSQFYNVPDAELRRIAAGLVEEQMGGVGRTGGVRQYISRLGELKSARATKAKL